MLEIASDMELTLLKESFVGTIRKQTVDPCYAKNQAVSSSNSTLFKELN